jgi:mycothiol synthase
MPCVLTPLHDADHDDLRALLAEAALAAEFDTMQGPQGVADLFADPFLHPALRWIARRDGAPVGFAVAFVLPGREHRWAMLRIGVAGPERRRGSGSAMLERAAREIEALEPDCRELCLGAWLPSDAAAGFAARHGFREARRFWLMERPAGPGPAEAWPAGVTARVFDGSATALADYRDAYNRSFAEHYHSIEASLDDCRAMMAAPQTDPKGVMLAYQGERCVGFCRNALYEPRGEIAVLGVVPEARGLGIGRSLLRWGVGWLARRRERITLMVDGENDSALGLYRSEGFETVRIRMVWSRPLAA